LSAVELGLSTVLAERPLSAKALMVELGLQRRGTIDFLDALVSLGMLERSGEQYRNTAATQLFRDRNKPSYVRGILEMATDRLDGRTGHGTVARAGLDRRHFQAVGRPGSSSSYGQPAAARGR
jgi:hypothetical protein